MPAVRWRTVWERDLCTFTMARRDASPLRIWHFACVPRRCAHGALVRLVRFCARGDSAQRFFTAFSEDVGGRGVRRATAHRDELAGGIFACSNPRRRELHKTAVILC